MHCSIYTQYIGLPHVPFDVQTMQIIPNTTLIKQTYRNKSTVALMLCHQSEDIKRRRGVCLSACLFHAPCRKCCVLELYGFYIEH